jgi:hypothetical protein
MEPIPNTRLLGRLHRLGDRLLYPRQHRDPAEAVREFRARKGL